MAQSQVALQVEHSKEKTWPKADTLPYSSTLVELLATLHLRLT